MPFSSFNLILLLPLFLISFWALPPRFQRVWLLVLSLIVYLAAGWGDLLLLLGAVAANWAAPRWLGRSRPVTRGMVVANAAFLGWFKYRAFLGGMVGWPHPMKVIIPLGISFYIFQLIAFQVELERSELDEYPHFLDFFLYIFFFPHHQAGPIMRPHAFLRCFTSPRTFFGSRFITGLLIFLWGLFKKVWIADLMAPYADRNFGRFHLLEGSLGSLPLLAVQYGIQIYGDFSGYSDMAVGMGRMFGFKFDRNFHQPYLASGASAFWQRWHVTLSQWLRDFIYIPLGGNRKGFRRSLANLMIVMLIGGLWHGAGWNFVLWGALHGLLLAGQRLLPFPTWGFLRPLKTLLFQMLVMLTWIPFRESSLGSVWRAVGRGSAWVGPELRVAAALFIGILAFTWMEERLERGFVRLATGAMEVPLPLFAVMYGIVFWGVLVGAGHATTFIYQRF